MAVGQHNLICNMVSRGRQSNNGGLLRRPGSDVIDSEQLARNTNNAVAADASTPRLTPYQRMRELLTTQTDNNASPVISTVEDLQAHLKVITKPERIVIRMKLLWISEHQHKQWRFIRLHFVDANSLETLEELLAMFRDKYATNASDVDCLLFTATMGNVNPDDDGLPSEGTIIDINSYSNLGLFRDVQCQGYDPAPTPSVVLIAP